MLYALTALGIACWQKRLARFEGVMVVGKRREMVVFEFTVQPYVILMSAALD